MENKATYFTGILILIIIVSGCTFQKNTGSARAYHELTTRYNVYYNGQVAYKKGLETQRTAHKENYSKSNISMFRVSDLGEKASKGSFDAAIEKYRKAIKAHSIKTKPKKDRDKMRNPKYVRFYNQEEFNPFLWNAWMQWGKAMYESYNPAGASTVFSYITRHYTDNDMVCTLARIWLARCYIEQNWFYEAEDVLSKIESNALEGKVKEEYDIMYTDYLIKNQKYQEAIPYLENGMKSVSGADRTRWHFLLAQLYQLSDNKNAAYDQYAKVIRRTPPYDMSLSARIKQTEVITDRSSKEIYKKLNRMAKSEKNKEYLDQVYYAIGNLYLKEKDTVKAIANYKNGATRSTRNGLDKAACLLKLGDLYYAQRKYVFAQPNYSEAFGLIDKSSDDYKRLAKLCPILDEMSVYSKNVVEQDSIQKLAKMPEEERMKVINTVIAEVIRKRKEAEKASAVAQANQNNLANQITRPNQTTNTTNTANNAAASGDRSWYFYNTQTVSEGKAQFQKLWGNRKLEDNWRRQAKEGNIFADEGGNTNQQEGTGNSEQNLAGTDSTLTDSLTVAADSLKNSPEHPEFYLAQLPQTEEDFARSDELIREGLYNVGVILKNGLNDYEAAILSLEELLTRFPENEYLANTYFNLFQIYYRIGNKERAEYYRRKLIEAFPEDENSILLASPNFEQEFLQARKIQDSVYAETYQAYLNNEVIKVEKNYLMIKNRYPKATLMPKYMFVYALSLLKDGKKEEFKQIIEELLKEYPGSDVNELAMAIGKGIREGRDITGEFNTSSIWDRKLSENDSVTTDSTKYKFSEEKNKPYLLIFAYPRNVIDNNSLIFEVANYNFTNFLIKNFDIDISIFNGIEMLTVSGFTNYDDALWYKQMFYERKVLNNETNKQIRTIIISKENFELLKKHFTFDDYFKFYQEHFGNVDLPIEEQEEEIVPEENSEEDSSETTTNEQPEEETTTNDEVTEEVIDNTTKNAGEWVEEVADTIQLVNEKAYFEEEIPNSL